jgi:ubiquinone biosynthesis protein Coq4
MPTYEVTAHSYQLQDSSQTLAAGLAEYHAANPGLADLRSMSPEAQDFFRCHDAAHVVFGCNVDLDDEAAVKIASMLGTTAGLGVLRGYRLHESIEIYKQLRVRSVLRSLAHSVVVVPRTLLRCARQRARWPWDDFDRFLDVPLREIRRELGITVAHPGALR